MPDKCYQCHKVIKADEERKEIAGSIFCRECASEVGWELLQWNFGVIKGELKKAEEELRKGVKFNG